MNAVIPDADRLCLTLVQTATVWHEPQANRRIIADLLSGMSPGQADLIALPEMFTTGFTMDSAKQAETMDGDTVHWMREMADRLDAVVTGTLVIRDDGRLFNRLIWMPPGGPPAVYDKSHLFRMAGEDRAYAAGTARPLFVLKGWRVRPLICYDLRFPVWCRSVSQNYDLLLCLANWPSPRHNAWVTLLTARAIENLAYVAAVNRVGTDDFGKRYLGSSMALDAKGVTLADAGDRVAVVHATLDRKDLAVFRQKFPVHLDADSFELA